MKNAAEIRAENEQLRARNENLESAVLVGGTGLLARLESLEAEVLSLRGLIDEAWNDGAKFAFLECMRIAKRFGKEIPDDRLVCSVLAKLFAELAKRTTEQ